MFEYLIYPAIGFVVTLVGLEAVWHFTACKIQDKTIKPLYVQGGKACSSEHLER